MTMKLEEIAKKKPDGTYVGTVFDPSTKKAIRQLMIDLEIPNRTPSARLHTTIIYSRKHVPELKPIESLYPLEATAKEFHIFETRDGNRALVLKLDCEKLIERHNEIMSEYQTTYDFPEYIPHITLSYDCGDFDPETYKGKFPKITITGEYIEDLILDWKDTDK